MNYINEEYPLSKETSIIIGLAMEVHKNLGKGFLEIVYKDALEYELKREGIYFEREKQFLVHYKDIILPHKFFADFIVFNSLILEIKAQSGLAENQYAQLLNYLAVSKCKVGLLLNFGESSLSFKRKIL
jgi:GxxExxY protein